MTMNSKFKSIEYTYMNKKSHFNVYNTIFDSMFHTLIHNNLRQKSVLFLKEFSNS